MFILIGLLLVALAAVAAYLVSVAKTPYTGEKCRIYIPANSSESAVSDSVSTALGTDFGEKVMWIWSLLDAAPEKAHGSYVIDEGENALGVARRLQRGLQSPIKVTFNNVRLISELAQRLSERLEFSPQDFIEAADSVLSDAGFSSEEYPAAFIPDTYEFYWTASPEKVVSSLLDFRNKFWTDERREAASNLGLSPVQVATVASIVEEETAALDERGMVARLYLNRIKKGMKLQADPTVKFAVGDFSLRRIGGNMLSNPSPYNTYVVSGLPPGPIRVPEKATLDAVLNAPEHNYLYMCAKSDFSGRHDFAVDYATHRANAARYQAELNRRGIKIK